MSVGVSPQQNLIQAHCNYQGGGLQKDNKRRDSPGQLSFYQFLFTVWPQFFCLSAHLAVSDVSDSDAVISKVDLLNKS